MAATPSETNSRCLHCDAALPAHDLDEGWCNACGKRLPTAFSIRPQQRSGKKGGRRWGLWLGGLLVLLALGGVAVYLATQ